MQVASDKKTSSHAKLLIIAQPDILLVPVR